MIYSCWVLNSSPGNWTPFGYTLFANEETAANGLALAHLTPHCKHSTAHLQSTGLKGWLFPFLPRAHPTPIQKENEHKEYAILIKSCYLIINIKSFHLTIIFSTVIIILIK